MSTPKVIAISAGRLGGNSEQFARRALEIISEYNIETELITLVDKDIQLEPCRHCKFDCALRPAVCATPDDFNEIFRKMLEADGIIISTPVYWGGMPPILKEVLHRAGTLSEGRVSADKPISVLGRSKDWPEGYEGRAWPETTKGPGLFARKVGGAIAVAQRDGALTTLAELYLWFAINNFIIVTSNYWTDGFEMVGRIGGGVPGGGTRVPKPGTKSVEHVRDILKYDREAEQTLEHFAENFAWLVNVTHEVRGTPEQIFAESRLSSRKWMDPEDRKRALDP